MRVLQCIGSLGFGGSQTFVMSLYRAIDRSKVQFDFVVFPENIKGFYEEVEQLGGKVYVCPRFSAKNCVAFVKWWHRFFKEHKEYSVIHGHVRSVAAIYLKIAKKYGLKTIVHSHSTSNGKGLGALVKKLFQKPLRKHADYLFSCSDYAGKWLYGEDALTLPQYKMIPNCVSCERFAYRETARREYRQRYGIPENAFVLGHIGRFREVKNHVFLVEVFDRLLARCPDARLLLVGDGELREQTENICREKGFLDKVCFTGNQANTEDYYAMMDVFILPSLWEGLPVCVVEAQASGLPCLITDVITRDVNLTDLVANASLEQPAEVWAEMILQHKAKVRSGLTGEQQAQLAGFDSAHVAQELQEFYLSIV